MKLPFKLSDSGIVGGDHTFITVKANPNVPNTGRVINKGYDFAILTDPILDIGNLQLMRADYTGTPRVMRLAINIPCSKRLLTNNTEQGYNPNGTGESEETGKLKRGVPFSNYSKFILDHGHEHIYMAKRRETDETVFIVTSSGLNNIPAEVRTKLREMSFLVRFTIKGPRVINNTRYNAGNSNINGKTILLEEPSTNYSPSPTYLLFAYANGPMRTIFSSDSNVDYTYESSFALCKHGNNYPAEATTDGFTIADNNVLINSDIRMYCNTIGNTDYSFKTQLQDSRLESSIFFEGGDRDISGTPIILQPNGSLNLVTMDNNLNSNASSASKFLSTVLSSNQSVDPEVPVPQAGNLDNLYVKI